MTKNQQSLVLDLLHQDKNLSDWSLNFLLNLEQNYWENPITQLQINKLHQLAKQEGLIE